MVQTYAQNFSRTVVEKHDPSTFSISSRLSRLYRNISWLIEEDQSSARAQQKKKTGEWRKRGVFERQKSEFVNVRHDTRREYPLLITIHHPLVLALTPLKTSPGPQFNTSAREKENSFQALVEHWGFAFLDELVPGYRYHWLQHFSMLNSYTVSVHSHRAHPRQGASEHWVEGIILFARTDTHGWLAMYFS